MPERSNNAGDSSDPHATTTLGARTSTGVATPVSGSSKTAATPAARPPSVSTRSARQRTITRAPASTASRR